MDHLNITEALDASEYPRVAAKVAANNVRDYWCESTECACRGCANNFLTWAEYECWKKYAPEFNKVGHAESLVGASISEHRNEQ